jgi:hypothetical protein
VTVRHKNRRPNKTIPISPNSPKLYREREDIADRIVHDSPQLDSIRRSIQEKGLDPIWLQLISHFGSVMYQKGRRDAESMSKHSKM